MHAAERDIAAEFGDAFFAKEPWLEAVNVTAG
jgi:hypothetical protein